MCEFCNAPLGHDSRCPNYHPCTAGTCELCGDVVYEGAQIIRIGTQLVHHECFISYPEELPELLGLKIETAT